MKKENIVYKLVDGDAASKLKPGSLIKIVADLIVGANGEIDRKSLLAQLEAKLSQEKPGLKSSASVVLSFQQRHLRDNNIIKMVAEDGSEVVTNKRGPRKVKTEGEDQTNVAA